MVNPIKNDTLGALPLRKKKKAVKEIDQRVKKVAKKSEPPPFQKTGKAVKATQNPSQKSYLAAEKAASAARFIALETKKAALLAQKKAYLAERAHLAQQAAAMRRARAAEKARKAAEKAAKKASTLRRTVKIRAFLARPEDKKQGKRLKKYLLNLPKKKKKQS